MQKPPISSNKLLLYPQGCTEKGIKVQQPVLIWQTKNIISEVAYYPSPRNLHNRLALGTLMTFSMSALSFRTRLQMWLLKTNNANKTLFNPNHFIWRVTQSDFILVPSFGSLHEYLINVKNLYMPQENWGVTSKIWESKNKNNK